MIIMPKPLDSDLHKIVLRQGGFYTEMGFLGCIGSLMAGSGLKEILDMIYAPNAVEHILTGKAIEQAERAHLLINAAVTTLIVSKALKVPIPGLQNKSDDYLQLNMNHTTMKMTFHQMHYLLRMVLEIVISKKHVLFLTN